MAVDQPTAAVVAERAAAAGETPANRGRRLALSTAFFSFATGISRVAGLAREIYAASLFGVKGPMSAFTIAFQVPNLIRALFADAALQGAFVPVFTELLEKNRKREAFKVASGLVSLIFLILGSLTIVYWLAAPLLMKLAAPGFGPVLRDLTVSLSRIMFPIVLIMAVQGVFVGMLNSFERFGAPAFAPVLWNGVIIAALAVLPGLYDPSKHIYAYAWGVLGGTVVQLLFPMPWLRGLGGRFTLEFNWRNPYVRKVLKLMLPVTIALGLINFSLLINSFFGTLVSSQAPAAIDKAFRIYMLPQGIFSVAIATILFPTLARFAARREYVNLRNTMANGMRQICLTLIPSAAFMAVLAHPITRLIYQRGQFNAHATSLVSEAMVVWAFSLPAQGVSLLLSRTFFSLQRPWLTTALAGGNLVVNAVVALALYSPFGVTGVVLGTVAGTVGMALAQAAVLRVRLGGIDAARTLDAILRMLVATAALCAAAYAVWWGLDHELGRALWAQCVSVGLAIAAGTAAYAAGVWILRVPEARQIRALVAGRLRSS
ncbi:MAG: murein biosynthesis integral membrane protein MurJ [Actinobacteria bacterium]|nr:MAG: murein biosynthesis integral membrane protein MurJ [Actinomycetota bacterium]TML80438.1 MAG: murein biosynthesis integral membrane protein MurJ [Actinomycetota bacterium]